jgi:SAM-dependent methyltransferase
VRVTLELITVSETGACKMVKEEVYNEEFFAQHISWKDFYSEIANWLWLNFKPKRVIDFGCGNGFIISELKKRGASVLGIEGSINALKYMPKNIKTDVKIMDITQLHNLGRFDLVISSEVAEHLPEEKAQIFITNLTNHASSIIYFTAAEPGQGGVDHINEQPHEYWIEKFNLNGFIFLKDKSKELRNYLQKTWKQCRNAPRWFIWNSMVFKKANENDLAILNRQLIFSRISLILPISLLKRVTRVRTKTQLRIVARSLKIFIMQKIRKSSYGNSHESVIKNER